jgi:hypothetical protein
VATREWLATKRTNRYDTSRTAEALLAPSGEEYDRCARRSVSLEQVRDRPFVIAVTNFDQPYSFMSAQRAIEAVFLGYSWMSNTQRRK